MTIGLIRKAVPTKRCESGSVITNSAHGGFGRVPARAAESRRPNVIIDRAVEVDELPFIEEHNSGSCEGLAHRGEVIHRVLVSGGVTFTVSIAKPSLPNDLSPAHNGNRHRRNRPGCHLLLN